MKHIVLCYLVLTVGATSTLLSGCCSHATPPPTPPAPGGKEGPVPVGNPGPRN